MIKTLRFGTGSGRSAVDYLLGEYDHKGSRRAEVRVLRGDPLLVSRLIDSLSFKHRYSSLVLAWHHGDAPSQRQIDHVLNGFEVICRSGLRKSNLGLCTILHADDDGSKHVHVLVSRVDLRTGKSFNVAPPGSQPIIDAFSNVVNFRYGWARPDVPSAISIPDRPIKGKACDDRAAKLCGLALRAIRKGFVRDRGQLIRMVEQWGNIKWEGHRHIKIVPHDSEMPIILKGAVFGKNFDFSSFPKAMNDDFSELDISRSLDAEQSAKACDELKNRLLRRHRHNSKAYDDVLDQDQLIAEFSGWRDRLFESAPSSAENLGGYSVQDGGSRPIPQPTADTIDVPRPRDDADFFGGL